MATPLKQAWLILFLVLASACNPAQEPAAPSPDAPVSSLEPRMDLPEEQRHVDLFGAWMIEGVEEGSRRVEEHWGDQILLVGNRELEVLSQCITIGPFAYGRTTGGGIVVRLPEVKPRSPEEPALPAPVRCARMPSPAERALPPILLAASDVERHPDGTIGISGEAGSLTLRRPSGAIANPRGQAPPPRVPPLLGAWQVASVDGRPMGEGQRMELLLRPDHIEWRSGCVNETRALRREGDTLLPGEVDPFPVCERGRSQAEQAIGLLLEGPIVTSMSKNGRLRLQGSGVIAILEPLTR